MRTVAFVLLMIVMAAAAGLSFVFRAGAQTASSSATLEVRCNGQEDSPPALPSGADSLLTCAATATNTGSQTVVLQMSFEPASVGLSPPDSYCFFSAVHDGVEEPVTCGSLSYAFGDVAPGAKSVFELRIVVRSTREYGADVVLRDAAGNEYARRTIHGTVSAPAAPPIQLKLFRTDAGAGAGPNRVVDAAQYRLVVAGSRPGDSFDAVTAEMAAPVPDGSIVFAEAQEWSATQGGHLRADLGPLPSGSGIERTLTFTPSDANSGVCGYVSPVVVVTAMRGSAIQVGVLQGDSAMVGACSGLGEGEPALPPVGSGGAGNSAALPAMRLVTLVLASGVALMCGGVRLRRRRAR